MSDGEWTVVDHDRDNERGFGSRSDAESAADTARDLGSEDVEIVPPESAKPDGGTQVAEVVEGPTEPQDLDAYEQQLAERTVAEDLGESVRRDPLDILPGYMIDEVQGTPTLNKRGISVLAHHYGVDTVEREILVSPHESEWEYAIVETTVENADGKTFVGTGTAHVERDDDMEVLLELAETRSYKRAVSFATGTGIVSYQEMVGDLE